MECRYSGNPINAIFCGNVAAVLRRGNSIRLLAVFILTMAVAIKGTGQPTDAAGDLVGKLQAQIAAPFPPEEGRPRNGVPRGELLRGVISDSEIFPGTQNEFEVYIPAQYDPAKSACLVIKMDGFGAYESTVLDNLIAKGEVPVMIGVGVEPGYITEDRGAPLERRVVRFNRSYEFDSMNDHFPDYVLKELLPAVERLKSRDGREIHISQDGNDRMAVGISTGGLAAFTLAWRRPDQFSRVYSMIGTFVSMRGAHEYPALIRKTEPKALRIFLEDGTDDAWNPLFGSWFDGNVNVESALRFAGYDVGHVWGTHGHDHMPGLKIFPDVMRWMWRDYPKPIGRGCSENSTLAEITILNEGWEKTSHAFQGAAALAADASGIIYVSDRPSSVIYRIDGSAPPAVYVKCSMAIEGLSFDAKGHLYGLAPKERSVVVVDSSGICRSVAEGIAGRGMIASADGAIFVSEPGDHAGMRSRIWRLGPDGKREVLDEGEFSMSGIAFSPDRALFYVADKGSQWIYSYIVRPGGGLAAKQPFYWLHMTDVPNSSGAEDIGVDRSGNIYVATRMGVQVCDQNGRVRAILPLPQPAGPVRSLCFGGPKFDVLYATDGITVFRRRLKIVGCPPWGPCVDYPSQQGG